MKAASTAQLSAADALLLDSACPDILSVLVFDADSESPSVEKIRDQVHHNIENMSALPLRLAYDPLRAGLPYRVRSQFSRDSTVVESRSSGTWDDALRELSRLTGLKVDPFEQCFKIHVFRNLDSAPTVTGTATLIALQVNHAITDGRGAARILQGVLGGNVGQVAEAQPLQRNPSWIHAGTATASVPIRLAWTYWRLFRAARAAARHSQHDQPKQALASASASASRTEDEPIDIRTIIFHRQDLKPRGFTVTETALTAVAISLPRSEGRSYQCEVPIAAPAGLNPRTVNNLVNVLVDLPDGTDSSIAETCRMQQLLKAEIAAARGISASARLAMLDGSPAFLVRVIAKNAARERDTRIHDGVDRFKLTSYQAVVGGASLCDTPPSFAMSIPTLRPNDRFTVNFVGFGDIVTATVASRPGPIEDFQGFVDRIVAAVADLNAVDAQHPSREG